jgi:hypothetical protein
MGNCFPPKPRIADGPLVSWLSQSPRLLDDHRLHTLQHRKPVHHPGSLVIHAARIRPMRNTAHAAATCGPKSHKAMPGLGYHQARVLRPGIAAHQPIATLGGSQSAVIGAGLAGDGEGAAEFFSASRPGCISALARQPMGSISSCGKASINASETSPRSRLKGGRS